MKEYTQLTLPHRYEISVLHKVGQGPPQISRIVGVHRTTILRELKRNRSPNGYYQAAHQRSQKRRADRSRPLKWTARCRRIVEGKLPACSDETNSFLYHMRGYTSISVGIETAVAVFIPTYVSNNTPSGFRPKPHIKSRFSTGFRLMTVSTSLMEKIGLVIGKSI